MNTKTGTNLRAHPFYGWWIVLAGFVTTAVGVGANGYMQSLLISLVRDEFRGGAEALGLAMAILGLATGMALLVSGPLIDRFGPRNLMLIGIPLAGIGSLGLGISNSLLMVYCFLALIGIGGSVGFLLPVQTATANWFVRTRAIALAIISAGAVLGIPLMGFVGSRITDQFGWRSALMGLGLLVLIIGVPLALIIRHRPENHGFLPDGKQPTRNEGRTAATGKGESNPEVSFTLREALRTRAFWLLSVAVGLASGLAAMATKYTVTYLEDQGFMSVATYPVLDIIPIMGLVGILIFGYLGDLFSKRHLLALAVAIQSAGVLILLMAGNIFQVYIFLLVFSIGFGVIPLVLAIRADYFGRQNFATITVAMVLVSGAIMIPLSVLLGFLGTWTYGISSGYQLTSLLFVLIGFIPAALFLFAKPP